MRIVRFCLLAAGAVGVVFAALLAYAEHENSKDVPLPSPGELHERLTRATDWVLTHREQILAEDNAMLWLFVRDAGRVSQDQRLLDLAAVYQARYPQEMFMQLLLGSGDPQSARSAEIVVGDKWQGYQRLFLYGVTCNAGVGADPEVATLLAPDGCNHRFEWLRTPWCRTHQLVGLRIVQQHHCEPDQSTRETIRTVEEQILRELAWDFRVEDAYIQKVMTLVASGRRSDIKPVWIARVLQAQRADGGWDGADVIAELPSQRVLSWSGGNLYPHIAQLPATNFHATAQGLYLLSMLSDPSWSGSSRLSETPHD